MSNNYSLNMHTYLLIICLILVYNYLYRLLLLMLSKIKYIKLKLKYINEAKFQQYFIIKYLKGRKMHYINNILIKKNAIYTII